MESATEILKFVAISIFLIIVGYQFYFLPQRKPLKKVRVGTPSSWDTHIPFKPCWVWIYSFLCYPFILLTIFTLDDQTHFFYTCLSFITLLFLHISIAFCAPLRTPTEWRSYAVGNSWSKRFLRFVQDIDKGGNCFPSMHVAVATLTALHITVNWHAAPLWILLTIWTMAVLIAVSAVYTKQHFVRDIIPGFLLAILTFGLCSLCLALFVSTDFAMSHTQFWLQLL